MKTIKFRQPIREKDGTFKEWFYWGFIDGDFISPALQSNGLHSRPESQQFTGLHDKNGKEIYEGDIVQRGIIVFQDGKFQGNYYEEGGSLAEVWEDDLCQERDIEVLGNIHENPELL